MKNSVVLITGATSGIGEACANAFAQAGTKLILFARRSELLAKISVKLNVVSPGSCHVATVDVRSQQDVENALRSLPAGFAEIDVLVNNAGLSRGLNPLHQGVLEDWEEMIDTNIKGLLYVTREVLRGMVDRKRGHIINVASIAGCQPYAGGNVYSATKAAVKMLSDSLQIDVLGTGVRICNVDPGMVETEFSEVRFRGDTERAEKVYQNYTPLTADDVAETILWVASRKPHVSIQDILITPTDQATSWLVNR